MDPVLATFLMVNGALLAGNGLLHITDPKRTRKTRRERKPELNMIGSSGSLSVFGDSSQKFIGRPTDLALELPPGDDKPVPNDVRDFVLPKSIDVSIEAEPVKPVIDNLELKRVNKRLTSMTTRLNTLELTLSEKLDDLKDSIRKSEPDLSSFEKQLKLIEDKFDSRFSNVEKELAALREDKSDNFDESIAKFKSRIKKKNGKSKA